MDHLLDEELARIIYEGPDPLKAWAVLYERYCHRILRYCYIRLGGEGAADVVQDTMLAFYKWAVKNEPPNVVAAVLFTIARRKCSAIIKEGKRFVPFPTEHADFDELEDRLEREDKIRIIRMFLMDELRGRERQVWTLRKLHDLPGSEVALMLGIEIGNVGVTLSHANAKWKRYLKTFR